MASIAKLLFLTLIGCVASDSSDSTCADSNFDNGGVNLLQKEMRLTVGNQVEAGEDRAKPTMVPLQNFHATAYDRYPTIVRRLKDLLPVRMPLKLLSFGCSYGAEVRTLRAYFPHADIDGVDVASEIIKGNKEQNKDKRVHYYVNVEELEVASYDAVLAMGVLCNANSTSTHLPHDAFVGALDAIDRLVRPGGLVVVYNANYPFSEYPGHNRYVNNCSQLTSTNASVPPADVKYDRLKNNDGDGARSDANTESGSNEKKSKKPSDSDANRGMCSTIDRSCIESGWGKKFNAVGEIVQPPNDHKLGGESLGCKFPGVFFQRLNEGGWPADKQARSARHRKDDWRSVEVEKTLGRTAS